MIKQARRRTFFDRALRLAGMGLLQGGGGGLVLVIIDRSLGMHWPLWFFVLPAVAGIIAAVLVALRRIPDPMTTAVNIDRNLHLRDQFGSAESLALGHTSSNLHQDSQFADLVLRDADRLASKIDVRTAAPIRITRVWGGVLTLGLVLWLSVLFLPSREVRAESTATRQTPEQQQEHREQREELAATIDETLAQIDDNSALDKRTRQELEALKLLAEQLLSENAGNLDVDQLRDESAARLNEIADQLAENAQRDLAAREQVARRFTGMQTPPTPPPARKFSDALKRGDFEQAAELLDQMTGEDGELTEQERQDVADHFRALSQQLVESDEAEQFQAREREAQIEQALRDQGLDDSEIESLLDDPPSPDDLQDVLERNNIDREIAQDLSRDIERLEKQRKFDDQVQQDSKELSEALEQAAKQVLEPQERAADESEIIRPESSQEAPKTPEEDTPLEEPAIPPRDTASEETDRRQDQAQESRERATPDPATSPRPQPTPLDQTTPPRQDATTKDQTQQEQLQQQTDDPSVNALQQDQVQPESDQDPGQSQTQAQSGSREQPTDDRDQPGPQEKQITEPAQPGVPQQQVVDPDQPGEQEQMSETTREASSPDSPRPQPPARNPEDLSPEELQEQLEQMPPQPEQGQQEQPQEQPSTDPDSGEPPIDPERLEDMMKMLEKMPSSILRKLAERAREAQKNQEISEEMKEQARRLAEHMSDEQRHRWMDLLEQQNRESPDANEQQGRTGTDGSLDELLKNSPDLPLTSSTSGEFTFEETEDLDIRGEFKLDQVIAEWLSDEPNPDQPGRTDKSSRTRRVQNAQQLAERAVNESVVPPRYHEFIKRYFNNLNQTVQKASGSAEKEDQPDTTSSPDDNEESNGHSSN